MSRSIAYSIVLFLGLIAAAFGQEKNPTPDFLVRITTESPRDVVLENVASGVLVDPQYILTCGHNIGPAYTSIAVRFKNGDEVGATVAFRKRIFDLAILKLDGVRYEKPVEVSDVDYVRRRQTVTVLGFDDKITDEVFNLGSRTSFRLRGEAATLGGPVLIDGKLVGVSTGWFPFTGIRCTNTPPIREFLENIK